MILFAVVMPAALANFTIYYLYFCVNSYRNPKNPDFITLVSALVPLIRLLNTSVFFSREMEQRQVWHTWQQSHNSGAS
jgi:hypothetical protein